MKQLALLSIPAPTMREYVRDRLCGFTARQKARDISRAEKRRKRKRIAALPPRRVQQEMFIEMRQPTLFDMEPIKGAYRMKKKPKAKEPEIEFVRCPACGNEQADMGHNVQCEECGFGPMPAKPRKVAE